MVSTDSQLKTENSFQSAVGRNHRCKTQGLQGLLHLWKKKRKKKEWTCAVQTRVINCISSSLPTTLAYVLLFLFWYWNSSHLKDSYKNESLAFTDSGKHYHSIVKPRALDHFSCLLSCITSLLSPFPSLEVVWPAQAALLQSSFTRSPSLTRGSTATCCLKHCTVSKVFSTSLSYVIVITLGDSASISIITFKL